MRSARVSYRILPHLPDLQTLLDDWCMGRAALPGDRGEDGEFRPLAAVTFDHNATKTPLLDLARLRLLSTVVCLDALNVFRRRSRLHRRGDSSGSQNRIRQVNNCQRSANLSLTNAVLVAGATVFPGYPLFSLGHVAGGDPALREGFPGGFSARIDTHLRIDVSEVTLHGRLGEM